MTTFRVVGVREKWKKNTFFSGCVHLTAAEVQCIWTMQCYVVWWNVGGVLWKEMTSFALRVQLTHNKCLDNHTYWFQFFWPQLLSLSIWVPVLVGVYSVSITFNYWSLIDCSSCLYVCSSVCIWIPVYCVHVPVCMCVYQDKVWSTRVRSFSYLILTIFTVP